VAARAHSALRGTARVVGRALRVVEEMMHALRQKLLARKLGGLLPPEHWVQVASDEPGLRAEDLRRHAIEVRRSKSG